MSFINEEQRCAFEEVRRVNARPDCASVVDFAYNWARLMERELKHHDELDFTAMKRCEKLADCGNNSGICFEWAKSLLQNAWKYGDLLKDYR